MSYTTLEKTTGLAMADMKSEAGVLTAWGARTFLLDADSSLHVLRERMIHEIGEKITADILCQAGFAGAAALAEHILQETPNAEGLERLERALAYLSQAGYADLSLDRSPRRAGEVCIHAERSVEVAPLRDGAGRSGYACDYLRGLLRGLVESLAAADLPSGPLECVETHCIANDDDECRFLVAAPTHLAQHGYRREDLSQSSVRGTLLRLNRQLEDVLEAAQRDALTGLFNRAHFESVLRGKIDHAKRRTDTLAVAMIDVDGFKEVNDGMGHAMGDLALRQIGHLLGAQARDTDLVARYGGDEFAWLMPGTTVDTAIAVADRIRRLVQEMRSELDLPISLSVGIASCPEDAAGMTDLIDSADIAMYQAKGAGGNQVRRYVATEQGRGASKRRLQKPRPRPAGSPRLQQTDEYDLPRLDLSD